MCFSIFIPNRRPKFILSNAIVAHSAVLLRYSDLRLSWDSMAEQPESLMIDTKNLASCLGDNAN